MKPTLRATFLLTTLAGLWSFFAMGADESPVASVPRDPAAEAEEQKLRQTAERFLEVLERNPRRGTALDRVFGYHIEAGTIDAFVEELRQRTAKSPQDGTGWMLLGLIEAQRGREPAAVAAFREAEKRLPGNALAAHYLGQALVLAGQPDEAAAAFERAIERRPARADLLEIFQSLGRLHQRQQQADKALAVWNRLETLFPDDMRVQEQIAVTLIEEGKPELALPRFEALARQVKDEYRVAAFRVEAADIKVKLGRSKEGLVDFEALLAKLNPDNWLYRDVRRRIDDIYLRNEDQAGLAAYYEEWLRKNPDDVEGIARLARLLAATGRVPEARDWLEKALKRAPTRKDLRLALIEHLLAEKRHADAIAQYEILARTEPGNPDFIREWGRLILRDNTRPEAERKPAAAVVWRKLLEARPRDSLTTMQVADLFRKAEMTDEALELYRRAVELSPDAAQYREYLGEYLHSLKRTDEALATWREIAAGSKRTAENLARLAEVLAGFGFMEEGLENIRTACRMDEGEFKYPIQAADLCARAEKYDEALGHLDAAQKLASNPEETEIVVHRRIRSLQMADALEPAIDALRSELATGTGATARQWCLLARYHDAARQYQQAARAIGRALALDEKSIPYRAAQARIYESSGNLQEAADAYRNLAAVDRRMRTEHLTHVARLESQRGRIDAALAAGRDLLAAAPGNPEHYEFFSQLCFQLGRTEEGLDALRRAVRLNPAESKTLLTLAGALAERFRHDEAIELYWRAFEKSATLDEKTAVVSKLAEQYLQTNHFDRLIERFERERREPERHRELTICLAQAHHVAGDDATARQELERLLTENSRDAQLLEQLGSLAESEGNLPEAIKYQQQLVAVAPGREADSRLARLLTRGGEYEEASAIWTRLTVEESDPARLIDAIDHLLEQGKHRAVLSITERLRHNDPQNWELLYAEGVSLAATNRFDEAIRNFRAIIALRLPDDDPGAQLEAQQRTARSRPRTAAAAPVDDESDAIPLRKRLARAAQWRSGASPALARTARLRQRVGPDDLGQARMASFAALLKLAESSGTRTAFVEEWRPREDETRPDTQRLWNWYYLQLVSTDRVETGRVVRRLAQTGDPLAQWLWLYSQASTVAGTLRNLRAGDAAGGSDQDVELTLTCLRSLLERRPEMLLGDGTASRQILAVELSRLTQTHHVDEADRIVRAIVDAADRLEWRGIAMSLAATRGDVDTTLALFEKVAGEMLAGPARRQTTNPLGFSLAVGGLTDLLSQRMAADAQDDAFRIFEAYAKFAQERTRTARHSTAPRRARSAAASRLTVSTIAGGQQITTTASGQTVVTTASGVQTILPAGAALPAGSAATRLLRMSLPQHGEHYDADSISMLQTTFAAFKQRGLVAELLDRFRASVDAAAPENEPWWRLTLAYSHWWNEDLDSAAFELAAAVATSAADDSLRLDLAGLHELRRDPAAALQMAESFSPLDPALLQERELLVMRVAAGTNPDRAKQAAERLAGMRLDSTTQVVLAQQLQELGMTELATTVLSRVRRQSSTSVPTLVALMQRYQAEQKVDQALQVAQQILRRSPPGSATPVSTATALRSGATLAPTSAAVTRAATTGARQRQLALNVLKDSGKLNEMIERVEGQLKASPQSIVLYQTLAEYYEASGNQSKAIELLTRVVELRPEDPRLQFQVGSQLAASGQMEPAMVAFRAAVRKDPTLVSQIFAQFSTLAMVSSATGQTVRRAGPPPELLQLLDEVDLRSVGPYSTVMSLMLRSGTESDEQYRRQIGRLWQAFPESRANLLTNLVRSPMGSSTFTDRFGQWPELHDYCRDLLIPRSDADLANPWVHTDATLSRVAASAGGPSMIEYHGLTPQFIAAAERHGRLVELKSEVEQTLVRWPNWRGGTLLLAMIHVAGKQPELAVPLLRGLLESPEEPIPELVCLAAASAFEEPDATRPLAIALFEAGLERSANLPWQYTSGPLTRLVDLHQRAGDSRAGRDAILRIVRKPFDVSRIGTAASRQRVQMMHSFGNALEDMGYPLDALRVYRETLEDDNALTMSRQLGDTGAIALLEQEYAGAIERALPGGKRVAPKVGDGQGEGSEALATPGRRGFPTTTAASPAAAARLAARGAMPSMPRRTYAPATPEQQERQLVALLSPTAGSGPAREPAIDLMLLVHPQQADRAEVQSLLLRGLRAATVSPVTESAIPSRVQELLQQAPDDLHVAVLGCMRAFDEGPASRIAGAVQRLMTLVERTPLEEIRPGARPSASQRTAATRHVALWLAARECLKSAPHREQGERLGARALESARRTSDPLLAMAILREWGLVALEQGDRASAADRWAAILDLSLASSVHAAESAPRPARRDRPLPPALPIDSAPRTRVATRPPTRSQFQQAMDVARLSAENGLSALSLRCVREAFAAGPPVANPPAEDLSVTGRYFIGGTVLPSSISVRSSAPAARGATAVGRRGGGSPQSNAAAEEAAERTIATQLAELDEQVALLVEIWNRTNVAAAEQYETLAAIVLPEAQPAEIRTYGLASAESPVRRSRMIVGMLASAAVKAGRADDLRRRVADRLAQTALKTAGNAVLAELDRASQN